MSSLVASLDNIQLGENNHCEIKYSSAFHELLTQFYFQLVRTNNHKDLKQKFDTLLKTQDHNLLLLLAKLTLHVRDMEKGKGERLLTYMMLLSWYEKNESYAYFIFETLMVNKDLIQPYASWKDVKYLAKYIYETTNNTEHPFIKWLVELTNFHLKQDLESKAVGSDKQISLIAKWIPREKAKKFKWFYSKLVKNMFERYYQTAKTAEKIIAADKKARKEYRIICSTLNKILDTTQIKQCNKQWRYIDPNKVTSVTFSKQKTAFFNLSKKNGKIEQRTDNEDRIKCKQNFVEYLEELKEKNKSVKGKRCQLYDFVKDAIHYSNYSDDDEQVKLMIDTINSQWDNHSKLNSALNNMIPLVDTSGSMETDNCLPLYNAIGLGIRIAEKTTRTFRNRVMTFTSVPEWINLDDCPTFCDKVKKVRKAPWGMNTNIYSACKLILDAIVNSKMLVEQVENLTLVILSDMQIDNSTDGVFNSKHLYENIKKMFQETGLNHNGIPYNPPNILFWNLRKTSGFPTKTTENNVTMLSGFNPTLLNILCDKGFEELKNTSPYDILVDLLNKSRYDNVNDIKQLFD